MVDSGILDYIRRGVSQGHTVEALKKHLIDFEYNVKDIQDAVDFYNSKNKGDKPKKVNRPKEIKIISSLFFAFSVFLFIVGLVSSALFGYINGVDSLIKMSFIFYFVVAFIGAIFYFMAGWRLWKMKF
jgi:hypothetical protein